MKSTSTKLKSRSTKLKSSSTKLKSRGTKLKSRGTKLKSRLSDVGVGETKFPRFSRVVGDEQNSDEQAKEHRASQVLPSKREDTVAQMLTLPIVHTEYNRKACIITSLEKCKLALLL